jgi:hypothetical protein
MNLIDILRERSNTIGHLKLAALLGVNQSTLYRYREGDLTVPVSTLRSICRLARQRNDAELLGAALAYAVGVDVDRPAVLGQFVAAMAGEPEAVAA